MYRLDESIEMEGRWENGMLADPEGQYQVRFYTAVSKRFDGFT